MSSPLHFIFDLTNHISTYDDDYEEARLQIEKDRNRGYIAIEDWLEIPKDMIESLTPFFWYEEWDIGNGYFDFILRGQINGDLDYIELIRAIKKFGITKHHRKTFQPIHNILSPK